MAQPELRPPKPHSVFPKNKELNSLVINTLVIPFGIWYSYLPLFVNLVVCEECNS
jgi:hypothetical protein